MKVKVRVRVWVGGGVGMGLGVERPLELTDGLQRLDAEEVLARELETRLAHGEGWGGRGGGGRGRGETGGGGRLGQVGWVRGE